MRVPTLPPFTKVMHILGAGLTYTARKTYCGKVSMCRSGRQRHLRLPASVFRLPSSVYRLPSSVFRLPSSVFRLPSS
eukprot:3180861-Prymnesium_polylepis.1